jgi:hypothetical protein
LDPRRAPGYDRVAMRADNAPPAGDAEAEPDRPLARAHKVALFERHVEERVAPSALELLLDSARVLAEGERRTDASGREVFFGSVMITLDLGAVVDDVRDPCDAWSARRIAALVQSDPQVGKRLRALAEAEAARVAGGKLVRIKCELRARAHGSKVDVDLDVEAALVGRT